MRSSAHVAQFLDRLEHFEWTNLFGNIFFRENVTKIPENAWLQWDPHSKRVKHRVLTWEWLYTPIPCNNASIDFIFVHALGVC